MGTIYQGRSEMFLKDMILDTDACYAALKAHDRRFDGRIFVGVSSTGIYCRPVCRVRMPKPENCTFHASPAAAEAAGFRPCLKCRPELAPSSSPVDASSMLAKKAAAAMDEEDFPGSGLDGLAARLGVTDRHLRRVFAAEYGVAPVQYLQTRRLLLAKHLLTDTRLSITEVAMAAGFGSIRRFNFTIKKHYRLSPRDLRKQDLKVPVKEGEGITLRLGYRPPYAWDEMLTFLSGRAIPGIEGVGDGGYCRTVTVKRGQEVLRGWFRVRNEPEKSCLAVTLDTNLLPALSKLLARIRVLFDVNCEPYEIYKRISALNDRLPEAVVPGLRLPGCFDPFEMSVRAVLGQQITVKAARTLAMRFVAACGQAVETPFKELTHTFPTYQEIVNIPRPIEDRLGPLGISGARARSILVLAEALADGSITLAQHADPEEEMKKLRALPGFGSWTAHYIAMRAMSWPDAFPDTDYGVKKVLAGLSGKEIGALAESFRPWRSYATIALWNSLGKKKWGNRGKDERQGRKGQMIQPERLLPMERNRSTK